VNDVIPESSITTSTIETPRRATARALGLGAGGGGACRAT